MMDITEDMVVHVCEKVLGTTKVTYQGTELDFSKGWKRMTMADAVKEYSGLDFMAMSPEEHSKLSRHAVWRSRRTRTAGATCWHSATTSMLRRTSSSRPLSPITRLRFRRWPSARHLTRA